MAQQYTDRAFESCYALGLGDITFLGPKFTYVSVPIGDSICLIEALFDDVPNGEWEVVAGVRTGNTFVRNTVVASSNNNQPVDFSGNSTNITLVVSSEFYESIVAAVNINTSDIAQNALDIGNNAGNIAQNALDIGNNAGNIAQNAIDIAQNSSDIANKENKLGNPAADGQALISTLLGVRSWTDLVKAFTDLSDSPGPYVGNEGKLVKVNATGDGLVYGDPSGTTVSWGDIQGLLSNQTDLQNALDAKLDADGTAANSLLLQGQDGAFYLDRANQTGLQDSNTVKFPNVNATDLTDLEHFYAHAWSAGVTDMDSDVIDGGGCTVNIPELEVTFRTSNDEHAPLMAYKMAAQIGLVIGSGNSGNVYADYNGGTPIFKFRLAGGVKLNLKTEVPVAVVACESATVLVLSIAKYNTDAVGLLVRRLIDLGVAHTPGGTVLGDAGTLHISITAGLFYLGLQGIPNGPVDTSVTDTFTYWHKDGSGGWLFQNGVSQVSNSLYDDGSGTLAPISNNDYSQSWVYINATDAGFTTHVLYGDINVNTESEVLSTLPPAEIPPILAFLGVLVGRVIVREGITEFIAVESAFATEYKPGSATAHNNLPGLQGGALDDYYHVTAAQIAYFSTIPALLDLKADIDGQVPITAADYTINALEQLVNANAVVDVFIYDTTKDDDGGAWVDEANNQSWYHEALNTADRGSTRKFPKLAIIVAEANKVTIYDGTKSDCPMWMVFNAVAFNIIASNTSCVSMLNGSMYVGAYSSGGGVAFIDFISDYNARLFSNDAKEMQSGNAIAGRNVSNSGYINVPFDGLVNLYINDLATISDGHMNNIVYVATDGGLSRIAIDGSVSNWTDDGNAVTQIPSIAVFDNQIFWATDSLSSNDGKRILNQNVNNELVDSRYYDSTYHHFIGDAAESVEWSNTLIPYTYGGLNSIQPNITNKVLAHYRGVTKLYPDYSNYGHSMICNIAQDFISGILHGDIRGAWLASAVAEILDGAELIVNGDFDTDINGWTDASEVGGAISWNALGMMNLTSDGVGRCKARQTVPGLIVGQSYTFATWVVYGGINIRLGNVEGGGQYIAIGVASGQFLATFVANGPTLYVEFNTIANDTKRVDDVSVRLADPDRSYKNNGLAVVGSITKSPVAVGAELQWYSKSDALNYLIQEYNPDLDFGTGDFFIMGWYTNLQTNQMMLQRGRFEGAGFGEGAAFYLKTDTGNARLAFTTKALSGANNTVYSKDDSITYGITVFVAVVRHSNGTIDLYINGELSTSTPGTVIDINDGTLQKLLPATGWYQGVTPTSQSTTLVRIGAGAPTVEQIKTISEQEKPLLNENAKCTLQGNSNNCQAVDYSESDNIVAVCSADHLTRFNDLVVVSDEPNIATSISRGCGDKEITGS